MTTFPHIAGLAVMKTAPVWGMDLGGTKIEILVMDPVTHEVLFRERTDTEKDQGRERILANMQQLVSDAITATGHHPARIGIATPGTSDPLTGLLKNSNTTCLNHTPVKQDLESLLGLPVVMANDANCFALAETSLGVIADTCPAANVVFGIIMGTGVGGGIVVNGKVIGGIHGIGGEWGHILLDDQGEDCYCGKQGCVETVISGPALERFYADRTGKPQRLAEIAAREAEDADAAATISHLINQFAKGVTQVINVLDPDAIVIGGGVGNIDALYEPRTITAIEQHLFNPVFNGRILKPALGDSAGVFGAAMLVAP
jgi:fructokinase